MESSDVQGCTQVGLCSLCHVLSRPPVAVLLRLNAVTVALIVLMAPMRYAHSGGYENSKAGEVSEV